MAWVRSNGNVDTQTGRRGHMDRVGGGMREYRRDRGLANVVPGVLDSVLGDPGGAGLRV